jgi:ubiquinone/menaquinone biosynthesis C-methylase UbiE
MPLIEDRKTRQEIIARLKQQPISRVSAAYWGLGYEFKMTSGCPEESNPLLAQRVAKIVPQLDSSDPILDIGSGRQYFVSSLAMKTGYQLPKNPIITLDVAPIVSRYLNPHPNIVHIQSDAMFLPFSAEKIGLVTSNMAIDYAFNPEQVIAEMFRVLKPGGFAAFTLMRPSMFSQNPDQFIDRLTTEREIQDYTITRHIVDSGVLTNSAAEVRQRFVKQGFELTDLVVRTANGIDPDRYPNAHSWWEVELRKKAPVNQKIETGVY